MYEFLSTLPRWVKSVILIIVDFIAITFALFTALCLRLNTNWPMDRFIQSLPLLAFLLFIGIILSYFLNLSSLRLRSYENSAVMRTLIWSLALILLGGAANALFSLGAPRTVPIIFGFVVFVYSITLRFNAIIVLNRMEGFSVRIPIAVYGAGGVGLQLILALKASTKYHPVMFIDGNKSLQGMLISGLRVLPSEKLEKHIKSGRVEKILLAMPSISRSRKLQIIQDIKALDCEVMELPSYVDIIKSSDLVSSLRSFEPDDLLGREGIDFEIPELTKTYAGKNILVTGAGGSIGSELCKKLVAICPKKIIWGCPR